MNGSQAVRPTRLLMAGLPLVLLLFTSGLARPNRASSLGTPATTRAAPDAAVQGLSFSVSRGDGVTATGVHPADILGLGGVPLIPCENLGLLCTDETGAEDDINSLSYGDDFNDNDLPSLQFSVDGAAQGRNGTAVNAESQCAPAQAKADAFESPLDGSNLQDLDGDGAACANNEGYGLSLAEANPADNIDALARDPCLAVDLNCDGVPEGSIYLTLAPGSPTLALLSASAADILVSGQEYAPIVWADRESLGLATGDVIDGLCLSDDGDGLFSAEDIVVLSLAPASPSLAQLSAGPGDLLRTSPLRRVVSAKALGLEQRDNVDALACAKSVPEAISEELYLPLIRQQ